MDSVIHEALGVEKLDTGAINRINRYPVDKNATLSRDSTIRFLNNCSQINHYQWIGVRETNCVIQWIVTYPVDSDIHLLNS